MTPGKPPRADDWEAVGRETLSEVLVDVAAEIDETVDPVADAVYWGRDVDAESVERLRRLAFEFEYAVEAYLAALCAETRPWERSDERAPSRRPVAAEDDE